MFILLKAGQRIEDDHHWLSDTAASVMISWAIANALVDRREDPDLRILPVALGEGAGIALDWRY